MKNDSFWKIVVLPLLVFFFLVVFVGCNNGKSTSSISQKKTGTISEKESKQKTVGMIRGNGKLVNGSKVENISPDLPGIQLQAESQVILDSGQTCELFLCDSDRPSEAKRKINIRGPGKYRIGNNEIFISKNGGVLAFHLNGKGLKVSMPCAVLGIRGTVLHIKVSEGNDQVWVEHGEIEWQSRDEKGLLKTHEGIKFSEKTREGLSQSPLAVSSSDPGNSNTNSETHSSMSTSTDVVVPSEAKNSF
ncbi:MAG: hypothetical protein HQM10_09345 [Candidatus Riflebacteria bacterium]|nr:hypothetical protein [Candidatus Riflebacteria bacterium]